MVIIWEDFILSEERSENSKFEVYICVKKSSKLPRSTVREDDGSSHSVPRLVRQYLGAWLVGHMRWNSVSESPYPPYRRSLHNSPRTSLGHHSQDACSSHSCSSDQRNKWGESLSGNREFIMSKSHIIAIRNHFLALEESWWSSVPLTFLMTHWFGPASGGCHWREPVCTRNSRAPFSQAPSQAVLSLTDPTIFSLCPTWSVPRISSFLLLCEYLLWDLGTD